MASWYLIADYPAQHTLRCAVFVQQIKVQDDDLVDEELGMLSDAVGKLKGMVKQIGEEAEETGEPSVWLVVLLWRSIRVLYTLPESEKK